MRPTTGGIVLCGGRSSRMGRPKAWLAVGGEPMLVRVVRLVAEAVDPVVIVAALGQELPDLPAGVEVVRDSADGNGPLHGLAAGLAALAGRADAAFVVGCDAPLLLPDFIRRVVALRESHDACVCEAVGFPRPLPGVYVVGVLSTVHDLLAAGRRSLRELLSQVRTRFVVPDELEDTDPALDSLRNVNTPDDYARVLADLQSAE